VQEGLSEILKQDNLIVTAGESVKLFGLTGSITDFLYCTYLSGLASDEICQNMGIGDEVIKQTKLASPNVTLTLM
jgi:hypothetical protein